MKNFFISYTSADRSWAEWIAWELETAKYSTVLQAWDFHAGDNFVSGITKALEECERTIAVYSPNYFTSGWAEAEWTAAFKDLLPVRVRECEIPKILSTKVYIDLLNLTELAARQALLGGLRSERIQPLERPVFPGNAPGNLARPKRFPGALPDIWNIPYARNLNFTGRDQMLRDLHDALHAGRATAITQAIAGMGGVGKTQLALEYAYRYAADYTLVWWVAAEQAVTLASEYAGLAGKLGLPEKDSADQGAMVAAVREWLTHNPDWLLILDNAPSPAECEGYRPPSNAGQILITSRNQTGWGSMAQTMAVRQLAREESIAFLQKRTGRRDAEADALAQELGDLPLALEHAAAFFVDSGVGVGRYLERLRKNPKRELQPVAATMQISLDKLGSENAAALDVLNLIAYLAPDNIPRDLVASEAGGVDEADDAIRDLRRYSMIETGEGTIGVHRLVQQVMRDRLDEEGRRKWVERAVGIVVEAFPSPLDYQNWPVCSKLLSHALAAAGYAEQLGVGLESAGRLLNQAGLYERERAQLGSAEGLLRRALAIDEKVYGAEHPSVAVCANNIGLILKEQGDLEGALGYARRALAIGEKVYGAEHPSVAIRANNIGLILKDQGDLEGALGYARRALVIDEKVYGAEHPSVAIDANNIGQILQAQGDLEGALRYARRALAIGEKVYGAEHPSVAIRANNIGLILKEQGDLEGALGYARRALAIDEKMYGAEHPNVAVCANNIGQILQAQGDLEGALRYARRALKIFKKVYGAEHPNVAGCANNIATILKAQGDLEGALGYARRALAIDEKVYGAEHPSVAIRVNNIGQILKEQGDLEGALGYARRALKIDEKVYGAEHPSVAIDANNIGQILKEQGDLEGALGYARRALKIDEKVYGAEHPSVAIDANNIGLILKEQGDLEGALRYARRALAIGEKVYGAEHLSVAIRVNNIATILQEQGDLEGALRYARRALAIDEKVYGAEHPSVAIDANNIGLILKEQGDLEGALRYARRALAIGEKVYGAEHLSVAIRVNNIATILQEQGDLEGALRYARRALAIDEKVYGAEHPSVAIDANNIATILQDQGDLEGALGYARRALKIFESCYGSGNPSTRIVAKNLRLLDAARKNTG